MSINGFHNRGESYLKEAKDAQEKSAIHARSDRSSSIMMARYSILMSAAGVEGYIFSLTDLDYGMGKPSRCMKTLREVLLQLEESNTQIAQKIQMAHFILTTSFFDKTDPVFRDFLLLVKLRNALIHPRSPQVVVIKGEVKQSKLDEKILKQLISVKACKPLKQLEGSEIDLLDWQSHAINHECALWAYETATNLCDVVRSSITNVYQKEIDDSEALIKSILISGSNVD